MTVFDQQNLENIIREQRMSLSGNFSDADFIRIGQLTNARFVVFGSIRKISNNYVLELAVTDIETGERKASYLPRQVSLLALQNLSAIREASADLLRQLGVNLTARGLQELTRAEDNTRIQAENALARGIAADRQGIVVEAFTHYFQAAGLDPSLREVVNRRVSVISSNASSGNLGTAVRSRLQIHDEWRTIVNTANTFYSNHLPYEFVYSTNVSQGRIDFDRRTVPLSIDIRLIPTDAWNIINDLRRGLRAARGNDIWNFNLDRIGPGQITVTVRILNENNRVLSTASHTFRNPSETNPTNATLIFQNVRADEITDRLIVQVVSINGIPAQRAGETGFIQISTVAEYNRRLENERLERERIAREARRREAQERQAREREVREAATREHRARLKRRTRNHVIITGVFWQWENNNVSKGYTTAPYVFPTILPLFMPSFHWSPLPFTSIGAGLKWFCFVYYDGHGRHEQQNSDILISFTPQIGFIFPLTNFLQIYMDSVLDISNIGLWQGIIADAVTPGFSTGIIVRLRDGNVILNFNYTGLWWNNAFTHRVAFGLGTTWLRIR